MPTSAHRPMDALEPLLPPRVAREEHGGQLRQHQLDVAAYQPGVPLRMQEGTGSRWVMTCLGGMRICASIFVKIGERSVAAAQDIGYISEYEPGKLEEPEVRPGQRGVLGDMAVQKQVYGLADQGTVMGKGVGGELVVMAIIVGFTSAHGKKACLLLI